MRNKTTYNSLRQLYRHASYRRFRARHRDSERFSEILGFGPSGEYMVGWLEGTDNLLEYPPDESDWGDWTIYV